MSIFQITQLNLFTQTPAAIAPLHKSLWLFAQHPNDLSRQQSMRQSRFYQTYQRLFRQPHRVLLQNNFSSSNHLFFNTHTSLLLSLPWAIHFT